jgi:hypothetical protein
MKTNGANIIPAKAETISKFGPSGSSIRKNINLDTVKEIISRMIKGTFFI